MSNADVFATTVDDLMDTCRDALIKLTGTAERLHLAWRESMEQHPDWERLAATVFAVCVANPIGADRGRAVGQCPTASFDLDLESYRDHSWIEARSADVSASLAFVRFRTVDEPFDVVSCAELDDLTGRVTRRVDLAYDACTFAFARRTADHPVSRVTVVVAEE